jgi:hypothetical protein
MTTLHEARFKLDQLLLERHAAGLPARVEQVDITITECSTNKTTDLLVFVYFAGGSCDDVVTLGFEAHCPPQLFDRHAAAEALLRCPNDVVH